MILEPCAFPETYLSSSNLPNSARKVVITLAANAAKDDCVRDFQSAVQPVIIAPTHVLRGGACSDNTSVDVHLSGLLCLLLYMAEDPYIAIHSLGNDQGTLYELRYQVKRTRSA